MTCPICGGETKVMDSGSGCDEKVRRRKCKECGHIFYTLEQEIPKKNAGKLLKSYKKRS